MWKRFTGTTLVLSLAVSGQAAAVSGLENHKIPTSISELFTITRHGVPVMGYLLTGLIFVILGLVIALRGGLTKTGAMIVAIGLTLFWYGLLPDLTAIILAMMFIGIVTQQFVRTLIPWIEI